MSKVFLSYRRSDSAGETGRLHDRLERLPAVTQVFLDVAKSRVGHDLLPTLEHEVAQCEVLIAVLGPGWLSADSRLDASSLAAPSVYVRREIEIALKWHIPILPVLVKGVVMPAASDLPETLRDFSKITAAQLRHETYETDVTAISRWVEDQISKRLAERKKSAANPLFAPLQWFLAKLQPFSGKKTAPRYLDNSGLRFEHVQKDYMTAGHPVSALSDFTLFLERGAALAVMGPSGSGKTTFLRIASLIERPTAGRIWIFGVDPWSANVSDLTQLRRCTVRYVTPVSGPLWWHSPDLADFSAIRASLIKIFDGVYRQLLRPSYMVSSISAYDSIKSFLSARCGLKEEACVRRTMNWLDVFALTDVAKKPLSSLSDGARQRLAFAHIFSAQPPIVCVDGAAVSICQSEDPNIMRRLVTNSRRLGMTLVIEAWNKETLDQLNRLVRLNKGEIDLLGARSEKRWSVARTRGVDDSQPPRNSE